MPNLGASYPCNTYARMAGYLVSATKVIPRLLGILLMIAGAGYLVNGFAGTLMSSYGNYETTFALLVFGPAFAGGLSFALWLLIKGVGMPVANRSSLRHG